MQAAPTVSSTSSLRQSSKQRSTCRSASTAVKGGHVARQGRQRRPQLLQHEMTAIACVSRHKSTAAAATTVA